MSRPGDGPEGHKPTDDARQRERPLPASRPPAGPRPPATQAVPSPRAGPETDWVTAVLLGIRDTAKGMLEAGRKGAHEAYDEGWERFEAKTKRRRHKNG